MLSSIKSCYAPYAIGGTALYQAEKGDFKGATETVATGVGLAAILRNPGALEYALKGIGGLKKAAPAAEAGAMSTNTDEPSSGVAPISENRNQTPVAGAAAKATPVAGATTQKIPDSYIWLQASDGKVYVAPPEAWPEIQKADPGAKPYSPGSEKLPKRSFADSLFDEALRGMQ